MGPGLELLYIVGATATGKSAVAVELALRLGGEVVSADSMQVYRGLTVLSAKPSVPERKGVPHHLLDVADPLKNFDVAIYAALAKEAIAGVRARGLFPIVAGGAGMYVRALADGIFDGPGRDDRVRARLETGETGELHERLRVVDPEAATRIHPNDRRRIVRALEIHEVSGVRPSLLRRQWAAAPCVGEGGGVFMSAPLGLRSAMAGIRRERADLDRRIRERVEAMAAGGAAGEAEEFLARCGGLRCTARQSLGLEEFGAVLEGRVSLGEAVEALVRSTRAYAKRQMTWFRRDQRVRWFDVEPRETAEATAERLARWMEGGAG